MAMAEGDTYNLVLQSFYVGLATSSCRGVRRYCRSIDVASGRTHRFQSARSRPAAAAPKVTISSTHTSTRPEFGRNIWRSDFPLIITRGSLHNVPCVIPRVTFPQAVVVIPNKHAIRVCNDRLLCIRIKHSIQSELRAA